MRVNSAMNIPRLFACVTLVLAGWTSSASAALVFSIGEPGETSTTIRQLPGQRLSFFISSNADDTIEGLIADFLLPAGGLVQSSQIGSATSTDNGFFASGNLDISSLTAFDRGAADAGFNINQVLTDDQLLTITPERWFEVVLDASSLALGTYNVTIDTGDGGFFDGGFNELAFNNDLQFRVVAIPEPGCMGLIAVAGVATLVRRSRLSRFKRRKRA